MALSRLSMTDYLANARQSVEALAAYLSDLVGKHVVPAANEHQLLVAAALVMLASQAYYWHKFSFWSRRNVKTPRPVPLFGNLHEFMYRHRRDLELEWPKKFGKVYGFYLGTSPKLVIADAKVLKQICVKDFAAFPNHRLFEVPNKFQKHFLISQKDDRWRGMRAIMSPTFSSGRIKTMYKLLHESADELIREHLRRLDAGQAEINTRQLYGSFSMSSALKSFYGLNLSLNPELQQEESGRKQSGSGSKPTAAAFARQSREAFAQEFFRYFITNLLPGNLLNALGYYTLSEGKVEFFAQCVKSLLEQRKKMSAKLNDYLQLLIDAKAGDEVKRASSEHHEDHHVLGDDLLESWRPSKMTLTDMEVQCQAMMLMMVATETTSTLVAHTVYLLAHHPDIQERLHREVKKIAKSEETAGRRVDTFDYDELISCDYMDCVVSESLRLMGPVIAMDRVASRDYYIEDYDLTVPEGTVLFLALHAIHNDPDYWPNPSKFDPERFSSANKHNIVSGSYAPFGIGNRACIGYRFALAEAKVGLAKMLREFKFEPAPNTKYPPEPMRPVLIQNDHKDLRVLVSKRN